MAADYLNSIGGDNLRRGGGGGRGYILLLPDEALKWRDWIT